MEKEFVIGFFVVGLVAVLGLLIIGQGPEASITGSVIDEKTGIEANTYICPDGMKVGSESECETVEDSLELQRLADFIKDEIQNDFPNSKGSFIRGESGEKCLAEFGSSCDTWFYPYEDRFVGQVYANVYDFGKDRAPQMAEVLELEMEEEFEARKLSNGAILVREFNREFGDTREQLFEVNIRCIGNYWVQLGFYQFGQNNFIDETGAIMEIASEVLDYCNN